MRFLHKSFMQQQEKKGRVTVCILVCLNVFLFFASIIFFILHSGSIALLPTEFPKTGKLSMHIAKTTILPKYPSSILSDENQIEVIGKSLKIVEPNKKSDELLSIETQKEEAIDIAPENSWKSLGIFTITAYGPYSDGGKWGYQTSTGVMSEHLATCAVDPKTIPLGSKIMLNGWELLAVDTGSAVKGQIVDIFYDASDKVILKWIESIGDKHEVFLLRVEGN